MSLSALRFGGRGTFVVGFEAGEVGFEDGFGGGLTGLEGCDAGYFAEEEFGFFLRSTVLFINSYLNRVSGEEMRRDEVGGRTRAARLGVSGVGNANALPMRATKTERVRKRVENIVDMWELVVVMVGMCCNTIARERKQ